MAKDSDPRPIRDLFKRSPFVNQATLKVGTQLPSPGQPGPEKQYGGRMHIHGSHPHQDTLLHVGAAITAYGRYTTSLYKSPQVSGTAHRHNHSGP